MMEPATEKNICTVHEAGQCQFFLTKKKRLCRFRPKPGHQYCPEHACIMGVDDGRKRIPCPLNSKHNCYEDELEKHLKVCNITKIRQKTRSEIYFSEGINKGTTDDVQHLQDTKKVHIKDLTSEDLANLIERVNNLYIEKVEPIETVIFEHPCVREEFEVETNEDLSGTFGERWALKKELLQQASLIGQLESVQCLHGNHCFVELGAGKGKLSHWIQKACKCDANNNFILVERGSVRYKVDGFHKQDDGNTNFKRIKIDIVDLNLGPIPEVESHRSVIVVGKHLCGGATDMGIRCAVNTLESSDIVRVSQHSSLLSPDGRVRTSEPITPLRLCSDSTNGISVQQKTNVIMKRKVNTSSSSNSTTCKFREEVIQSKSQDQHGISEDREEEPSPKSPKLCCDGNSSHSKRLPSGIMIALCCHHRCTWETYVGKKFMAQCRVSPQEFDLLTRLSSWATCAKETAKAKRVMEEKKADTSKSKHSSSGESKLDTEHCVEDLMAGNQSATLRESLSVSEREEIGLKSKRLIDMGRLHYLRAKGMQCYLRKYVNDDLTPENVVLIAKQNNKDK